MKVLVIGSGGREHALAWRLRRSKSVSEVVTTPGNPGSATVGSNIVASSNTPHGYLELAKSMGIDLTVVGPEAPLVAGVVDVFESAGLKIVGPAQAAAQLEGSKIFAKDFMRRAGIPTARYISAYTLSDALQALSEFSFPVVLKADGLAAGKGVIIAASQAEAEQALRGLFSGDLVGAAGSSVVIEECLVGEEVSFMALSDGDNVLPLAASQDHKRVFDNDEGPNTGGMGAYSDDRILTASQRQEITNIAVRPVIEQMKAEGTPFKGFLYAGLMMTRKGPQVLEYNVRLGDPETQALLHRMDGDFGETLWLTANGRITEASFHFREDPSVCVVMAAANYPATPHTGDRITGIDAAEALGATVFHAGTKLTTNGLATSGGRVLGVTHSGSTLPDAIENAYRAVEKIHFDGMHYRRDIGAKGLVRWQ